MENEAFEAVYRENAEKIFCFLVRRGCPPQEAEDLVQDTFVKALLHIDRFRGECALSVWLCRIAWNTWMTQRRRQGREIPFRRPETARGDQAAEQETGLSEWMDLVERLEEPCRWVFLGRAVEGLTYEELARRGGRSESWARVTYYRARMKLMEMAKEGRP